MKYGFVLGLIIVFLLGWLTSIAFSEIQPVISSDSNLVFTVTGANELPSPSDWVKREQIKVYKDRIVIEIPNAVYAEFSDTNSMDPVLDFGANGIEITPQSADQIQVGDIIAYESEQGTIIHRVIEKGFDSDGVYFIAKGDNNKVADPHKIRFEQVKRVLVALIY
jgi:signal peptidase I